MDCFCDNPLHQTNCKVLCVYIGMMCFLVYPPSFLDLRVALFENLCCCRIGHAPPSFIWNPVLWRQLLCVGLCWYFMLWEWLGDKTPCKFHDGPLPLPDVSLWDLCGPNLLLFLAMVEVHLECFWTESRLMPVPEWSAKLILLISNVDILKSRTFPIVVFEPCCQIYLDFSWCEIWWCKVELLLEWRWTM